MWAGPSDEQEEVQDRRGRAGVAYVSEVADRVLTLAISLYPDRTPEIILAHVGLSSGRLRQPTHDRFNHAAGTVTAAREPYRVVAVVISDVEESPRARFGSTRETQRLSARSPGWSIGRRRRWSPRFPPAVLRFARTFRRRLPCTGLGSRRWRTVPWRRTSSENSDAGVLLASAA